jgi:hypothetical protein
VATTVDPVPEPVDALAELALDVPPPDFAADDPHEARTTSATIHVRGLTTPRIVRRQGRRPESK